jgi:hypothetical protein
MCQVFIIYLSGELEGAAPCSKLIIGSDHIVNGFLCPEVSVKSTILVQEFPVKRRLIIEACSCMKTDLSFPIGIHGDQYTGTQQQLSIHIRVMKADPSGQEPVGKSRRSIIDILQISCKTIGEKSVLRNKMLTE